MKLKGLGLLFATAVGVGITVGEAVGVFVAGIEVGVCAHSVGVLLAVGVWLAINVALAVGARVTIGSTFSSPAFLPS